MNVKLTLDLLMARLGRKSPELRAMCLTEMQQFQENDLEGGANLPWFIITEDATALTKADEPRLPLPPDFIREVDERPFKRVVIGGKDVKLHKWDYNDAFAEFGDEARGVPLGYAIKGNYIFLFPTPDDVYTIKIPGYFARQHPPVDSTDSETPWFKWWSDLILASVGLVIATSHLKDPDLAKLFVALGAKAQDRVERAEVAREEANRDRVMEPK